MGTWGTSITQNDTFLDVYSDFYEKWKSGTEVRDIIEELKNEYLQEEDHEYWFALSKCLWEIGSLPEDVFEKVKGIILSGDNLSFWEKSGAEESSLQARDKALKAFLRKLSIPNPKPKLRKAREVKLPKKILKPQFDRGDCIAFKLDDKRYGGAVILDKDEVNPYGYNLVAITTIFQLELPVIEDFINSEVLSRTEKVFRHNSQIDFEVKEKEQIYWLSAKAYKQEKLSFERIGNIGILQDDEAQNEYDVMFFWSYMASLIMQEINYGGLRAGRKVSEIIKIDL